MVRVPVTSESVVVRDLSRVVLGVVHELDGTIVDEAIVPACLQYCWGGKSGVTNATRTLPL